MKKVFKLDFNERQIVVETGELAKQANGSVLVRFGDTAVQYFFVYTGESDVTNDDLISSVINTIQIWDTQILVQ